MTIGFRPLMFDSEPTDIPLRESIGLRDGIATFESQFTDGLPAGASDEAVFLRSLRLANCAYGAADCPVYPLLISLGPENRLRTGRDVLTALGAREFKSAHIQSLDETSISFPGYHPGTDNDEIHDDEMKQNIFAYGEDADASTETHVQLKDFMADKHLWYVLLHTTPKPYEEFMFSDYVVLFAVGNSQHGDFALGVVSHQICHNLCD